MVNARVGEGTRGGLVARMCALELSTCYRWLSLGSSGLKATRNSRRKSSSPLKIPSIRSPGRRSKDRKQEPCRVCRSPIVFQHRNIHRFPQVRETVIRMKSRRFRIERSPRTRTHERREKFRLARYDTRLSLPWTEMRKRKQGAVRPTNKQEENFGSL